MRLQLSHVGIAVSERRRFSASNCAGEPFADGRYIVWSKKRCRHRGTSYCIKQPVAIWDPAGWTTMAGAVNDFDSAFAKRACLLLRWIGAPRQNASGDSMMSMAHEIVHGPATEKWAL